MGIGAVSQRFCCVCGTEHHGPASCPGELRATGAEKPGWRINVETPFGHAGDRRAAGAVARSVARAHRHLPQHAVDRSGRARNAQVRRRDAGRGGGAGDRLRRAARRGRSATARDARPRPSDAAERRRLSRALAVMPASGSCVPSGPLRRRARDARGMTVNLSVEGMFIGVATPPEDGGRSLLAPPRSRRAHAPAARPRHVEPAATGACSGPPGWGSGCRTRRRSISRSWPRCRRARETRASAST